MTDPAEASKPATADHVEQVTDQQTTALKWQGWLRVAVVIAGILLPFLGYDLVKRPAQLPPPGITAEQIQALIDAAAMRAKIEDLKAKLDASKPQTLPVPK